MFNCLRNLRYHSHCTYTEELMIHMRLFFHPYIVEGFQNIGGPLQLRIKPLGGDASMTISIELTMERTNKINSIIMLI